MGELLYSLVREVLIPAVLLLLPPLTALYLMTALSVPENLTPVITVFSLFTGVVLATAYRHTVED